MPGRQEIADVDREERSDAQLVTDWLAGDVDAFAAIYDRYADSLYAFALSRLRDRSAAADVVQVTFERALGRLGQLRERERLRSWLFTVARRLVFDQTGRVHEIADDEGLQAMAGADGDHGTGIERTELAELVWAAADGLTDRDREVLALHLRHGLDGAELGAVVGVSAAHAYVLVNRVKERMERAVGALLVARHGRRDCDGLARVLAGWDGRFSLDVRSRVVRHVESCDECQRRRRALVSPDTLTAGALVPTVTAPADLRSRVVDAARRPAPSTAGDGSWAADGFPRPPRRGRRGALAAAVAMVVVLATIGGVALARNDEAPTAAVETSTALAKATTTVPVAPSPASAPPTIAAVGAPSTTGVAATSSTAVDVPTTTVVADAPPATTGAAVSTAAPTTAAPTAPTTAAPAATTAATVAPPPPPPAAPPGRLVVLDTTVDFGTTATTRTVRLGNDGGSPVAWTASTSSSVVSPGAGGTVAPGATGSLLLRLDRVAAAEGVRTFTATVQGDDGSSTVVVVTATVEHPPTIVRFDRSPTTVRTSTTCGQTLTTVTVEAIDQSGIASVKITWSSDGTFATVTTLVGDGRVYSGRIGSFTRTGTATLTAKVTDGRGNVATATTTVSVVAC